MMRHPSKKAYLPAKRNVAKALPGDQERVPSPRSDRPSVAQIIEEYRERRSTVILGRKVR